MTEGLYMLCIKAYVTVGADLILNTLKFFFAMMSGFQCYICAATVLININ